MHYYLVICLLIINFLGIYYCDDDNTSITTSTSSVPVNGETTVTQTSTIITAPVEISSTETTTTIDLSTEPETTIDTTLAPGESPYGFFGGFYQKEASADHRHFIHGKFQSPIRNYYLRLNYFHEGSELTTPDYYFGYALERIKKNNFNYSDYHHFDHLQNRSIDKHGWLQSNNLIDCNPYLQITCPENTETLCLNNGTIFCVSRLSAIVPEQDQDNNTINCVPTTMPCVLQCLKVDNELEEICLKCISTIIIHDVYENKHGKTLRRVGKTYIEVDALTVEQRTYCLTVIFDPDRPPGKEK